MAEAKAGDASVGRRLRRALRYRWPLAPVAGCCLAAALAALLLPMSMPSGGITERGGLPAPLPAVAGAEDLSAFRASRRWGRSLLDVQAAEQGQSETTEAPDPAQASARFVGQTAEVGDRTVLLVFPDGNSLRLAEGDALPDGRTLASVGTNTVTLRGAEGDETMPLFPPLPEES